MVRSEGLALNPQLSVQLADLGRDLPLTQVTLQPRSQAEILQLIEAIVGEGAPWTSNGGERRQPGTTRLSTPGALPAQQLEPPLVALRDFLVAHTGRQPLYRLQTLR